MKRYLPLLVILAVAVFLSTTGFQCGSAETTSAKLYINQKQWEKAEQSLVKALAKNDKDEEAWFLLGQVRLELKRYNEMNEAFTRALAVSDVHKAEIERARLAVWATLYNEGVGYYNKGRDTAAYYTKAVENFTTAINMVPDSSGTYYVLALAQYAKDDIPAAKKALETALVKKPDFGDAAVLLGSVNYTEATGLLEAKDTVAAQAAFMKAAEAFEVAYKADPVKPDNITNLIDVYERTKQSDKALSLTKTAVERDPANKLYRYAYGVFLLKQDNYSDAIGQFEKAVEIDPEYVDAIYNLGVSYLNWGVAMKEEGEKKAEAARGTKGGKDVKEDVAYKEKFKLALPHLERAAEIRSDDAALWQSLGRLYMNLNMMDKGKAAFDKADRIVKGK
jgi:tetratricopeptide (TPR) repeat protein